MGAAILTFVAVFILLSGIGSLLFYQRSTRRRLASAVAPSRSAFILDAPAAQRGARVARFVEPFQRILPKSPAEVSVVQKRLIRAGYREKTYVNIFYGAKVLVPILLCLLVTVTRLYAFGGFFVYVMALGAWLSDPGFLAGQQDQSQANEDCVWAFRTLSTSLLSASRRGSAWTGRFSVRPKNCN